MDTKKILIGEVSETAWLMDAVEKHIKENPMIGDGKIHSHFKMRIDLIATILTYLRVVLRIERIILGGKTYYRILEITEEDIRAVSMETPFGTFN